MATTTTYSNDMLNMLVETQTVSAALTLTKADSGKVFILDASAGKTITLPELADGLNFKFIIGAAFATDNWIIDSAEGDNINGFVADLGTTVAVVVASGEDQINFVASAETIGDHVTLIADYGNSQWLVSGACAANGGITVTDPS
jgi:hypothetical protein